MMFREVKKCVLICQAPDPVKLQILGNNPGNIHGDSCHRSSKPWTHVVPTERNLTPQIPFPTSHSQVPRALKPAPHPAVQKASGRPAAPSLGLCSRGLQAPVPAGAAASCFTSCCRADSQSHGCVVSLPLPPPSRNLLNTPHAGGGTQWWQQQVSAASVEDIWGAGGVEPTLHDARNHLVRCQRCLLLSTFTCISVCAPANLLPEAWQVLPAHLPGEESRAHLCPVGTAGKRQGLQAPTQSTLSSRVSPGNHGVHSGSQPSAPRCWGGHLGRGGLCLLLTLESCT